MQRLKLLPGSFSLLVSYTASSLRFCFVMAQVITQVTSANSKTSAASACISVLPQALRELEHGHAGPVRDEGAQGAGQEAAVQAAEPAGRGELPHDRERRPPLDLRLGALLLVLRHLEPVWKSKFYGAFVLNRRVVLHAIDATPARWRGDAGSSPLDRARTAASSPRNDLVKNFRVHPTHWLISTQ